MTILDFLDIIDEKKGLKMATKKTVSLSKVKIFKISDTEQDQANINNWLEQNPHIEVLFVNNFSNETGWGCMIFYKEEI